MQAYKNVAKYPESLGIQELIDMHVCPIVKKMLDEGPDQKNIDAIRTYELLTEISGGGRGGRAALFQLEEALEDVLTEVTTCFYKTFYDGRQTAWKGFRKITREFVFDIEEMPYGNYTKYLYERLHSFIKGDILEQEFLVAANAGNKMASIDALTELAYLFTHSVEGTYENTLAYQAGMEWLKRYKKENMNQDELSMQPNFFDAIPFLIDSERPELVLQYMEWDERIETAVESYTFTNSETMKALCWGIYQIYCREVSNSFFEIMKVLVNDDNTIDVSERAIFFDQDEAEKALLDWSTNNREHLLCYVMRTIPMCEHYSDDFIQAVHYAEGEQLKDDMLCKEFVYMPTGFRRKQNFNIGDNVKYICFDGRSVLLRHSRIFQIQTKADESIQMNDGFVVPARYVFSVNNGIERDKS